MSISTTFESRESCQVPSPPLMFRHPAHRPVVAPSRPTVVVVTPWYPSADDPVSGVFVRDHVAAIAERMGVAVVHLRDPFDGSGAPRGVREREHDDPWPLVEAVPGRPALAPLGSVVALAAALRRLRGRAVEPDVLHAHVWSAALPTVLLARARRLPAVVTEHSTTLLPADPSHLTGAALLGARIAYRLATERVAVGNVLADRIRALSGREVAVIPNPIDGSVFDLGPGGRAVTSVGALIPLKGFDRVIRAFALAREGDGDLVLHVVGDGPERRGLERLAEELGVAPAVQMHGACTKATVARLMRESDAVVSGSTIETFGVTMAEALMCGTPVVATSSGGPLDIVGPGDGQILTSSEPAALAGAIREVGRPRSLEERAAIRARAGDRFSFEAVRDQVGTVYDRVLQRRVAGSPARGGDRA